MQPRVSKPLFIVVEGIDGSGKSSQIAPIVEAVQRATGKTCLSLREPGSTPIGEKLRDLMLAEDLSARTHMALMFAAREEMLHTRLLPALEAGSPVVCDRYVPSTVAYQCAGQGADPKDVEAHFTRLQACAPGSNLMPDLCIYFDLMPEQAAQRMAKAADASRGQDVFERRGVAFFERVRDAYLHMSCHGQYARRWAVVDASRAQDAVRADAVRIIENFVREQTEA